MTLKYVLGNNFANSIQQFLDSNSELLKRSCVNEFEMLIFDNLDYE